MNTLQPPPATDFDAALEFCVSEIQAGRLTLDECLDIYRGLATRLEPLLKLAGVAIAAPHPAMPPEARHTLEQQLRARLVSLPAPRRVLRGQRSLQARWLPVAAAALLAVVAVGAGTVAAAAGSLPGDWLYPVKRWTEAVSLQFAGDADRADLHLSWARRRLDEFAALVDRGVVDAALLDGVTAETEAATASSDGLDESRRIVVLTRAAGIRMTALSVVSSVRERTPEEAEEGLDRALTALEHAYERALGRLPPLPAAGPAATRPGRPSDRHDASATPTPPGRGTPGGGRESPAPGQGAPGGGQDATPPGQGAPEGGPPDAPPGQESKPPKDK